MVSWPDFLLIDVCKPYNLSPKEQAIFLAKFPDPDTIRTNEQVAQLSNENKETHNKRETVRKHMVSIYNKLTNPPQNCTAFPNKQDYNGEKRDPELLEWLKQKYAKYSQPTITPPSNSPRAYNPFIPQTGKIDKPQLFFNREKVINNIFETLNTNSSVALIGEEGIGKSSLLSIICQQAKDRLISPRTAIYLDFNLIENEEEFYTALCEEIEISQVRGYQLNRALQNQRILLALDNLGKLTRNGFTRQLRDYLRGFAEGSDAPLRLIVAASEPLENLFDDSQDGGKTSPLVGICRPEYIKPWNENTARKFIETRLQTTPVRFTEAEIAQLIKESAGHPRKLMQLCYECYQKYSRAHQ